MALSCSKKISALLHGITSKHKGDFYCLNCLHSIRKENKPKSHEKVCKHKDFYGIEISSENYKILEFNQYMKSDKVAYIIYADMKYLIKKIDGFAINPENFSTTKIGQHIPCGYLMSAIWAFDHIENESTSYREKDCMEKICTSLREQAKNITDFEKKTCYC